MSHGATTWLSGQGNDDYYELGPDSLRHDGVPHGEVVRAADAAQRGVSWDAAHLLGVCAWRSTDVAKPASLMVFQEGARVTRSRRAGAGDEVIDNLVHRGEIPVMLAVFINPGRDAGAEGSVGQRVGCRGRRPQEYNAVDDKYARVILRRTAAGIGRRLQHFPGAQGPRDRRVQLRGDCGVYGGVGAAGGVLEGAEHRRELHKHSRRAQVSRIKVGARASGSRFACFWRTGGTTTAASGAAGDTTRRGTGSCRTYG